jgi:predicted RNase H-like HicB family nuclease
MDFPVVIHKDEDSDYGVTVPDLPGCFAAGRPFYEALAMARQAINTHLFGLRYAGKPIPTPRDVETHRAHHAADAGNGAVFATVAPEAALTAESEWVVQTWQCAPDPTVADPAPVEIDCPPMSPEVAFECGRLWRYLTAEGWNEVLGGTNPHGDVTFLGYEHPTDGRRFTIPLPLYIFPAGTWRAICEHGGWTQRRPCC